MADMKLVAKLEDKATEVRKQICLLAHKIGSAHLGGSLSSTDMAVALYYHFLNFDPKDPKKPDRDRYILSKGHTGCLYYNIFADLGIYDFEFLYNGYNKVDGKFGQHPNRKYVPGIEASTGSLGHGLSIAVGCALAARAKKENWRTYCMMGDGEIQEGSVWEAVMQGAQQKLSNLVAIVDRNRVQGSGFTEDFCALDPLEKKWEDFGWNVISIDGNDMVQIVDTLENLPPVDSQKKEKPTVIIMNTIKGKGVPFMENSYKYHIVGLDDEKVEECCRLIEENRVRR